MSTDEANNLIPEESKNERAARKHFARVAGSHTLAVIDKSEDGTTADISAFTRDGWHYITVQVPVNDYLEAGAQQMARRYGDKPVVIHADQELTHATIEA